MGRSRGRAWRRSSLAPRATTRPRTSTPCSPTSSRTSTSTTTPKPIAATSPTGCCVTGGCADIPLARASVTTHRMTTDPAHVARQDNDRSAGRASSQLEPHVRLSTGATLLKHNPALLPDDLLEQTFAAREPLLADL